MPTYDVIFPEQTIKFGYSFSKEKVTLELMSSILGVTYKSQVRSSTIENVELDRQSGKLQKTGTAPRDLYSLICAAEEELQRGSPRNQYEKNWGTRDYDQIKDAIKRARTALKPAGDPSQHINFNPPALDLGAKIITGQFRGNDRKHYSAILEPLSLKEKDDKVIIERDLDVRLEEGFITAVFEYRQNGECILKVELPNIANHKDTFGKEIRTYTNNAERSIVRQRI